jgi:hypothetical protein
MVDLVTDLRVWATTTFIVLGLAIVPARAFQSIRLPKQYANPEAFHLADASATRPLTPSEMEVVFREPDAEARVLRIAILAVERGESTTWLQLRPVVAGWFDVPGATEPILAALRAYLASLRADGTLAVADYLNAHGAAGYRAEVFLHWPTLRDGLRTRALEMGLDVEVVESSSYVRLAQRESEEAVMLPVEQRVRDALALKADGFPADYRILELGQPAVDALVGLYLDRYNWPAWTTEGKGRQLFIEAFVDVMTAWGDPRWVFVTPAEWAELSPSMTRWLREAIDYDFGKTWPDHTREALMLNEYLQREYSRRNIRLPP